MKVQEKIIKTKKRAKLTCAEKRRVERCRFAAMHGERGGSERERGKVEIDENKSERKGREGNM